MPRHSQALSLPDLTDGEELLIGGRYQVAGRLGKGGAGSVFRVYDKSSERELALKRLSKGANAALQALFEREYYTLSTLKHPNVVEVYEYGADTDGPYYTMELLTGTDLSDQAPMAWREACEVTTQVAAALAPLHARRLLHRDVGPRNLWRTTEGAIKLIDFGALAPFGSPGDVVGTPPFVAPEALEGRLLDQRTDLYALGGVLYWLLTGTHAFRARALRDLPSVWAQPFVSASSRLEGLGRGDLLPLPVELEALIEALLSQDPNVRPANTGDIIDRIRSVAGLARDARPEQAQLFVQQAAFVGRDREQRHFERRLALSANGTGGCTIVEARSGEGRSRMLVEFAIHARVAGATVLPVDAGRCDGVHGLALALALRLFDSLPQEACSAAEKYAATLAHLSPKLASRLSVGKLVPMPAVAGEGRARLHEALTEWFCELSRSRQLVLLIDDVHRADEASIAWLLTLTLAAERHNMLLVVGLNSDTKERSSALRGLLQHGRRVLLRPLEGSAVRDLLASLFGEVHHLTRLAERLHRAARGNPAHVLELAQHLVRKEAISCVDGTWVLPQDIADELLAFSRGDALSLRLERLSDAARAVGRVLSVRQGLLSLPMGLALTDLEAKDLYPSLSALVAEGVLIGADGGYRFSDEPTRLALCAELTPESHSAARRRLGRLLLKGENLTRLEQLEAHLLLLDQDESGESAAKVAQLAQALVMAEPDSVGPAGPLFVAAYKQFKAQRRGQYEMIRLLAGLAMAGYFHDRKLLARYAERAVEVLSTALKVPLMRRLRPFLGRKLSLYVGLFVAGLGFKKHKHNPCVPSLKETIGLFFNMLTSLAGASTIFVDPRGVGRQAELLEPFTALGEKTPAPLTYEFVRNLESTVTDHVGRTRVQWQRLIDRLRDPSRCATVPEQTRLRMLGGALYALGVIECWVDGPTALRHADELDNYPIKLYRMSADQLRAMYYANQGDLQAAEHYGKRAEVHAIQRGTAWQIEIWATGASTTVHLRTADAHGIKQSVEQMQRLAKSVPSIALLLERARGAYLLLRRHYEEALPLLEGCLREVPGEVVGWGRTHGVLARALNALGRYARAKEVCERAFAYLTPEDLSVPAMNLGLQLEHLVAEAGLGEHRKAIEGLEALLERHRSGEGPLTLGAIHEARTKVAMIMGDEAACRSALGEMERFYRGTQVPSLVARCELTAKEVRRQFEKGSAPDTTNLDVLDGQTSDASSRVTAIERELSQAESLPDFSERALRLLAQATQTHRGALWLISGDQLDLLSQLGFEEFPETVHAWVEERVTASLADDVTQTAMVDEALTGNPDLRTEGDFTYRLSYVRAAYTDPEPLGVLLLGSDDGSTETPSQYLLSVVGIKLKAQLKRSRTSISTIT